MQLRLNSNVKYYFLIKIDIENISKLTESRTHTHTNFNPLNEKNLYLNAKSNDDTLEYLKLEPQKIRKFELD